MEITFACPGCGKSYTKDASLAGKRARCKRCTLEFRIPAGSETPDAPYALAEDPPPLPRSTEPASDAPSTRPRIGRSSHPERGQRPDKSGDPKAAPKSQVPVVPMVLAGAVMVLACVAGVGLALVSRGRRPAPANVAPVEPVGIAKGDAAPKAEPVAEDNKEPESVVAAPRVKAPPPSSTADLVARVEPSVALVKGKRGSGTGFLIRPGILVTNTLVIDGETVQNLEIRFPSADVTRRGPLAAKLIHKDARRGLAFLAVDTDLPALTIAAGEVTFRKGDDVTVIGNPAVGPEVVLENAVSRGVIGAKAQVDGRDLVQLGISISPGSSGGPVLDSSGEVIGVVLLKTAKQEGLAFCVPVADLNAAMALAESKGDATANSDEPARALPGLNYGWTLGNTYVYSVDISIDVGSAVVGLQGASVYRVKAVDDEGITLGHRGWLVIRPRGKDGKVTSSGVKGPTGGDREVELKIDRKGNVLSASGASPLPLLGDLSTLVIEPFPDEAEPNWEDSQSITLAETEQVAGSGGGPRLGRPDLGGMPRGGRSRLGARFGAGSRAGAGGRSRLGARSPRAAAPAPSPEPPQVKVTAHSAQELTRYSLGPAEGDAIPITKNYELTTDEKVENAPRLKMTGEGKVAFDAKAGIPVRVDYRARVVETSPNATIRVPIVVACRLLTGEERARMTRPPVMPPTALNPVTAAELKGLVVDLKTTDPGRRRVACDTLIAAVPVAAQRATVSRALERVLSDNDEGIRGLAARALGVWGDAPSRERLVKLLGDEKFGARDQLFEALGRFEPSVPLAEAVIPWLATDGGRAGRTLRAMGTTAEGPLLRIVQGSSDTRLRGESCRVLKEIGGPKSVPILETISRLKDGAEVGRVAKDSLRAIARRFPSDDEWEAIHQDLTSLDAGHRREAGERLIAIGRVEARRAEVARALETLSGDKDRGVQEVAFRALASWGDKTTLTVLLDRLADPKFRPDRAFLTTFARLGRGDTRVSDAVVQRFQTDRFQLSDTLRDLGPTGEASAVTHLANEKDRGAFEGLCDFLGRFGTEASLPGLRDQARMNPNANFRGSARRAAKAIESRLGGDRSLATALADLKSPDHDRVKHATERLAATKPGPTKNAEIARALDALLEEPDVFMRPVLMRAESAWGDDQTADALAARLGRKDLRDWRETLQALLVLRPDDRSAALAMTRIGEDSRYVATLLPPLGPAAERALVDAVKSGGDRQTRIEACRVLGEVGTPAVIPALTEMAGRTGDEQVARDADDALKAITARL